MSDVWEYFQKIQDEDNTIILSINCQLCEAEYGVSTSTTTLRRYLTGIHSSVYTSNKQKQPLLYTLAEQKHITVNLAQWISVDLQPFSVVERVEFQQFIHTLDSRYTNTMQTNYKARSNLIIFTKENKCSIRNE